MYLLGKILAITILLFACAKKNVHEAVFISKDDWTATKAQIRVSPNDDLTKISNKFSIDEKIIVRHNNLKKLTVGSIINIPPKFYYNVRSGDSVISIARKFGLSFSELVDLNQIDDPNKLTLGKKLKVIEINKLVANKIENNRFIWPIIGKIEKDELDDEIKITANGVIKASANGKVVFVGNEVGNHGNLIIIEHRARCFSSYGALDKILVSKNDIVKQGQEIGVIENKFLYFGIRLGANSVNPLNYLEKVKN